MDWNYILTSTLTNSAVFFSFFKTFKFQHCWVMKINNRFTSQFWIEKFSGFLFCLFVCLLIDNHWSWLRKHLMMMMMITIINCICWCEESINDNDDDDHHSFITKPNWIQLSSSSFFCMSNYDFSVPFHIHNSRLSRKPMIFLSFFFVRNGKTTLWKTDWKLKTKMEIYLVWIDLNEMKR